MNMYVCVPDMEGLIFHAKQYCFRYNITDIRRDVTSPVQFQQSTPQLGHEEEGGRYH